MTSKLIVALDFDNELDALNLVEKLDPKSCGLKVGSELFTLLGTSFVKQLIKRQFNVFLDLKFHDIPNTVAKACKAGADLGVWMMNVHASGGMSMMQAARKAIDSYGVNRPILIAVTVLTSFKQNELTAIGVTAPVIDQVKNLAILTKESGLDGVVSSAQEVKIIKSSCNDQFITVTPGIRLASNSNDDQSRVMSPKQAIEEGSDFLVVGRPITQAANPEIVVDEILSSIQNI
ncbi:orotidine-5'-phosphate decarboxylase [Legionella tucsonensis]|uniref:Orotidine 5'-phosphate decarboxylase n=1 Tax=Legionella tucsonensis TaxID=40335 RepID=A0A0W0ZVN3_9GAMM|nr:orotidine-5'-phosphate decarboxylase [Legionella tucsonensis]KTD73160.1 orotidine 5`-phosphate decarboxylase [Legionella tucsonensis]